MTEDAPDRLLLGAEVGMGDGGGRRGVVSCATKVAIASGSCAGWWFFG